MPNPLQNALQINQQILSSVLLKKHQEDHQAKQELKYTIILVFEQMGSQGISLWHKDWISYLLKVTFIGLAEPVFACKILFFLRLNLSSI